MSGMGAVRASHYGFAEMLIIRATLRAGSAPPVSAKFKEPENPVKLLAEDKIKALGVSAPFQVLTQIRTRAVAPSSSVGCRTTQPIPLKSLEGFDCRIGLRRRKA